MQQHITDHCHGTLMVCHKKGKGWEQKETQNTELKTFLLQQMKTNSWLQYVPYSMNDPALCPCFQSYPVHRNTCTDESLIFAQKNCVCFLSSFFFFPPNCDNMQYCSQYCSHSTTPARVQGPPGRRSQSSGRVLGSPARRSLLEGRTKISQLLRKLL